MKGASRKKSAASTARISKKASAGRARGSVSKRTASTKSHGDKASNKNLKRNEVNQLGSKTTNGKKSSSSSGLSQKAKPPKSGATPAGAGSKPLLAKKTVGGPKTVLSKLANVKAAKGKPFAAKGTAPSKAEVPAKGIPATKGAIPGKAAPLKVVSRAEPRWPDLKAAPAKPTEPKRVLRPEANPLSKKDFEMFNALLLEERTKILRHLEEVSASSEQQLDTNIVSGDAADIASVEMTQANLQKIGKREGYLLKKIDLALVKIKDGTYGECESCGEPISIPRLKARPVAQLCIDCKTEQELEERRFSSRERSADDEADGADEPDEG